MRAVENTNLSCTVHLEIIRNYHVETALIKGDLVKKSVISFYYPKMEIFTRIYHLVVKTDLDSLILGISRVDAVNQGIAEDIVLLYPSLEAVTKSPKIRILKNTLLKIFTVLIYKLARKENKSRKSRVVSRFEKLCELSGK